jgi:superfamily I DNA/RNA helicase
MPDELHKLDGPVLVLAGPGTGKTTNLAKRIKYLVEDRQTDPNEVTVITFTRAAAQNMRAKISNSEKKDFFVPPELQPAHICTMHSLGNSIIEEEASEIGVPPPSGLLTDDDMREVLLADAAQISGFRRSDAQETDLCRRLGNCQETECMRCRICASYKKILKACGYIDYDDQILLACKYLRENPNLLARYQGYAKNLLVDEYQDINAAQFEMIKILSGNQLGGLFIVGDDDQSIYSWRGGTPEYIRNPQRYFGKEIKVMFLSHSFRCHRHVLEGALGVIKRFDKNRCEKEAFEYEHPEGPMIEIHETASGQSEAVHVRAVTDKAVRRGKSVLLLVPTHRHIFSFAEHLRFARIGFVAQEMIPGDGLPVFQRIGAWLQNTDDSFALRLCIEDMISGTYFGVPSNRVRKPPRKDEREKAFAAISALWQGVIDGKGSLWGIIESEHGNNTLLKSICETCEGLKASYSGNLGEFLQMTINRFEPWKNTQSFIDEATSWVGRYEAGSDQFVEDPVRIMTLQKAKGLEADIVCVVGLEEGTIPREGLNDEELAEQSRLFYVSMTRAKEELHLFSARTRSGEISFQQIHGKGGSHMLTPSRFITAIPDDFSKITRHPAPSKFKRKRKGNK